MAIYINDKTQIVKYHSDGRNRIPNELSLLRHVDIPFGVLKVETICLYAHRISIRETQTLVENHTSLNNRWNI